MQNFQPYTNNNYACAVKYNSESSDLFWTQACAIDILNIYIKHLWVLEEKNTGVIRTMQLQAHFGSNILASATSTCYQQKHHSCILVGWHRKNITPILSKVAGQAWNQDHIINTNQNSQELCMSILLQLYSLN